MVAHALATNNFLVLPNTYMYMIVSSRLFYSPLADYFLNVHDVEPSTFEFKYSSVNIVVAHALATNNFVVLPNTYMYHLDYFILH